MILLKDLNSLSNYMFLSGIKDFDFGSFGVVSVFVLSSLVLFHSFWFKFYIKHRALCNVEMNKIESCVTNL